jgi:hypothetical protein
VADARVTWNWPSRVAVVAADGRSYRLRYKKLVDDLDIDCNLIDCTIATTMAAAEAVAAAAERKEEEKEEEDDCTASVGKLFSDHFRPLEEAVSPPTAATTAAAAVDHSSAPLLRNRKARERR